MRTVCIALIYLCYRIRQINIAYKDDDIRLCLILFMPILFWIFFIAGQFVYNLFLILIMILITAFFTVAPLFTFSLFDKYWSDYHMKYVISVDIELICFIIPSWLFGSLEGGGVMASSSVNYDVYLLFFKLFELDDF